MKLKKGDKVKCIISGIWNDETNCNIKRGKTYDILSWEQGVWRMGTEEWLNEHDGWDTVTILDDKGEERKFIDGWFEKL